MEEQVKSPFKTIEKWGCPHKICITVEETLLGIIKRTDVQEL